MPTDPFLDPAQFPWTALLEEHYPAIRAEAERVLRVLDALPNVQDTAPDEMELSPDGPWKTFWFVGYDVGDDPNCRALPRGDAAILGVGRECTLPCCGNRPSEAGSARLGQPGHPRRGSGLAFSASPAPARSRPDDVKRR